MYVLCSVCVNVSAIFCAARVYVLVCLAARCVRVCVSVCVCMRVRACIRGCVCVYFAISLQVCLCECCVYILC